MQRTITTLSSGNTAGRDGGGGGGGGGARVVVVVVDVDNVAVVVVVVVAVLVVVDAMIAISSSVSSVLSSTTLVALSSLESAGTGISMPRLRCSTDPCCFFGVVDVRSTTSLSSSLSSGRGRFRLAPPVARRTATKLLARLPCSASWRANTVHAQQNTQTERDVCAGARETFIGDDDACFAGACQYALDGALRGACNFVRLRRVFCAGRSVFGIRNAVSKHRLRPNTHIHKHAPKTKPFVASRNTAMSVSGNTSRNDEKRTSIVCLWSKKTHEIYQLTEES